MGTVEQDKRDVAAVIEQYRLGFATLDVETLNDLWDQGYENIIYIPLEAAHPVRGWAAVEQYYNATSAVARSWVPPSSTPPLAPRACLPVPAYS